MWTVCCVEPPACAPGGNDDDIRPLSRRPHWLCRGEFFWRVSGELAIRPSDGRATATCVCRVYVCCACLFVRGVFMYYVDGGCLRANARVAVLVAKR